MRRLLAEMDGQVVAAIDARLDAIERDGIVRIGLAVESGSRAWGFRRPTATMTAASSMSGDERTISLFSPSAT